MSGPTVFLFSGQGSQYYRMGEGLYKTRPVFREWMDRLDKLVIRVLGQSVLERLYDPTRQAADAFDDFRTSHLAIFMTEYALARCLMDSGLQPDVLIGASLGEFVAAAVAGAVDPEHTVEVLAEHAPILEAGASPGGMLAVLGDICIYQDDPELQRLCDIAAVNSDTHFVLAGELGDLERAESLLRGRDAVVQRLPVPYGFHSRHIDPLREDFLNLHEKLRFTTPSVPIISCATGSVVEGFDSEHLWRIIRWPIRLQDAVEAVQSRESAMFVDVGPSGSLAAAIKNSMNNGARAVAAMTPFGNDAESLGRVLGLAKSGNMGPTPYAREEANMQAIVFPGQGAQKIGMGEDLFDHFPELVEIADRVLGYSIRELCLDDPQNKLGQTEYTQPALFTVNALGYLRHAALSGGVAPAFLAGHSLGEYNALFAAGVFDFETGLRLVDKRGELMSRVRGGGMAAVVGLSEDRVRRVIKDNGLDSIQVANCNTPSQFVLAGPKQDVERVESLFIEAGADLYRVLNVSGAFHTVHMGDARREFETLLDTVHLADPQVPVMANVNARPYVSGRIKETLAAQIDSPVQWVDSIRYLMGRGVEDFLEIGPSQVQTQIISAIIEQAEPLVVDDEPVVSGEESCREAQPEVREDGALRPEDLGSDVFKKTYGLRYAYVAGGMHHGIASRDMVASLGRAGMIGFYGAAGLDAERIEQDVSWLAKEMSGHPWGVNLTFVGHEGDHEGAVVDILLRHGVRNVEAANYIQMTEPLVRFRLKGLRRETDGSVVCDHRILAKTSRPEVAETFLSPPPEATVQALLARGEVSPEQAELASHVPMADHLCALADGAGHTEQAAAYSLLPALRLVRDEMVEKHGYGRDICVGAGGGIGTPEAAAAALVLGADFLLTGSVNQCTVESGAHDMVKDMLQQAGVQDTDYAPSADMFELGGKVQVLRKGVFFPARANKLYSLYRHCDSLDGLNATDRTQLEERFFRRTLDELSQECERRYSSESAVRVEADSRHTMSLVFRAYCDDGLRYALAGDASRKVDFQVWCGQAMGAFNQWARNVGLEPWRSRRVVLVAERMLEATAAELDGRVRGMLGC